MANGSPVTQDILSAQAHDIRDVVTDALGLLPGLGNGGEAVAQQSIAILLAQMQQMNTNLTAQMHQLNGRMDDLSRRMTFSINATALISAEGSLLSFPNANNIHPDIFPQTTAQFLSMTGPQLQALLLAYDVQNIPHALDARRARARQLITTGL